MTSGEGLRERKRRQTRARLTDAAMTLFLERGFEATTVDDIAAAAEVSKRSFFDYFPTKEDVVSAWQDEFGSALADAVAKRPAGEALTKVVEEALISSMSAAMNPQSLAIAKLIRETPALSERNYLKYSRLEQRLAEALADRVKGEAGYFRSRLLALIVIGALRIAEKDWHRQETAEISEPRLRAYAKQVFQMVWAELRALGDMARESDTA